MGRGTYGRWWRELERPSPAPGTAAREQPVRITAEREIASSRVGVGGVVVAITGEDNITRRSKGPLLRLCLIDWEESVHGRCA